MPENGKEITHVLHCRLITPRKLDFLREGFSWSRNFAWRRQPLPRPAVQRSDGAEFICNATKRRFIMPKAIALKRARRDARAGKKPSTQAGEFIREEMHALHQGSGNVRSPQQAIAIGLSEARRAGIKLGVPQKGSKTCLLYTSPSPR